MPFDKAAYHREYMRNRYQNDPEFRARQLAATAETNRRNRQRFQEFKATLKCERCGESDPAALDFHHLDPSEKDHELSNAMNKWGWSRVMREIEKCIVLCANCHRKEHARQRGGTATSTLS